MADENPANAPLETHDNETGLEMLGGRLLVQAYVQLGAIAALHLDVKGGLFAESTDGLMLNAMAGATLSWTGKKVVFASAAARSYGGTNLVNAATATSALTQVSDAVSNVVADISAVENNSTRCASAVTRQDIDVSFAQLTADSEAMVSQARNEINELSQNMAGSRQTISAQQSEVAEQSQIVAGQMQEVVSLVTRVCQDVSQLAAQSLSLSTSSINLCGSRQFS
jgi:hypothetical protein